MTGEDQDPKIRCSRSVTPSPAMPQRHPLEKQRPDTNVGPLFNMARLERFELPTARFVAEYSIQLSYRRKYEARIFVVFCHPVNPPADLADRKIREGANLAMRPQTHRLQ